MVQVWLGFSGEVIAGTATDNSGDVIKIQIKNRVAARFISYSTNELMFLDAVVQGI
jgi:hypothetical protein